MEHNGRSTSVLNSRPPCDICTAEAESGARVYTPPRLAVVDGATTEGPWAYMCGDHFITHGLGLGMGRGQVLLCGDSHDNRLKAEFGLQ